MMGAMEMTTFSNVYPSIPRWHSNRNKTQRIFSAQVDSNDFEVIKEINKKLVFVNSITVKIKRYDGCFNIDWDKAHMRLVASGETRQECIEEFLEDLASNWEYISKASDDELTEGALIAKKWLEDNIKEVS